MHSSVTGEMISSFPLPAGFCQPPPMKKASGDWTEKLLKASWAVLIVFP